MRENPEKTDRMGRNAQKTRVKKRVKINKNGLDISIYFDKLKP